ncbi:hypothetical protein GCM10023189_15350 [Nibrella saemangeumensis]|uniref:Uncharacterized protein n=1 Tax=Nibrella saemangeumensis TaxID=1084526 RepID=A0ABP8MMA9_9BACT
MVIYEIVHTYYKDFNKLATNALITIALYSYGYIFVSLTKHTNSLWH